MSRPRFAEDQRTYGEWLKAKPRDTKYAKEIIRKHEYFPDKSLSQLRKLKIGDYDLSTRAWDSLSDDDKTDRDLAFEILREMRRGENFTHMLKKVGLKKGVALKHLGKNLYKLGGTWKVTASDSIQSENKIYSIGHVKPVVMTNSKDRLLGSQYLHSVDKALKNNDPSVLDKFKDLIIIDASGKEHRFEINLQVLYEIKEAQEEPEFLSYYAH